MKLLIVDDEIRAVQALVKRVNWQEYDFEPPLAAYSMAPVCQAHDKKICNFF